MSFHVFLIKCILIFLGVSTVCSAASDTPITPNIVDVTPHTFFSLIDSSAFHVVLLFGAEWCSHCRALKPVYDEVAEIFADDENVLIGSVRCDEYPSFCSLQKVPGYPTIRFYPKTDPNEGDAEEQDAAHASITYNGDRTTENLTNWIKQNLKKANDNAKRTKSQPKSLKIDSQSQFDSLAWNKVPMLVYFYSEHSQRCKRFDPIWESLAKLMASYSDRILLARIPGYSFPTLKSEFQITPQQYPALVFLPSTPVRHFQLLPADMPLTLQSLITFLNEKIGTILNLDEERALDPRLDQLLGDASAQTMHDHDDSHRNSNTHASLMQKLQNIIASTTGMPQDAMTILEKMETQPDSPILYEITRMADSNRIEMQKLHLSPTL